VNTGEEMEHSEALSLYARHNGNIHATPYMRLRILRAAQQEVVKDGVDIIAISLILG